MKRSFKWAATALFVVVFTFVLFNNIASAEESNNSGRMAVMVAGSDELAGEAMAATEVVIGCVGAVRNEPGFKLNAPLPREILGIEVFMGALSAGGQRMESCITKTECMAQACRVNGVSWALIGSIMHRGDERTGEFVISLSLFDASTKEFVLTRTFNTPDWGDALASLSDEVRLLLQQPIVGRRVTPAPVVGAPSRVSVVAPIAPISPPAAVSSLGAGINLGFGYGFIQVGVDGSYRMGDSWRLRAEALFHKSVVEPASPWPSAEVGVRLGADYEFSAWQATAGCGLGFSYLIADVEPGFAPAASCGGGWVTSAFGRRVVVGMRPEAVLGDYKTLRLPLSFEMGLVEVAK